MARHVRRVDGDGKARSLKIKAATETEGTKLEPLDKDLIHRRREDDQEAIHSQHGPVI